MFAKLPHKLYVILGPTASGKTHLACHLAKQINGEIVSADSRQVYKGMDLGSGKDLIEYNLNGVQIPYHLIDIRMPDEDFSLFDFQEEYYKSLKAIWGKGKSAVLSGGSGLYLERAISPFELSKVPFDNSLRKDLASKTLIELQEILLEERKKIHNQTDSKDRERALRAIEIARYENSHSRRKSMIENFIILGIQTKREEIRKQIEIRLDERLENGLVEEVRDLLSSGISHEKLIFFGLEYAFVSRYLNEELSYSEMREKLLQAIRRFAKKQMTWFRRMERKGAKIHWIDAKLSIEEKLKMINLISNG